MKKIVLLVIIAVPLLLQSQNTQKLPGWVNNTPTSKDMIYAVGIGTSGNPEIAERKAGMDARVSLAEIVQPVVVSVTSRIDSVVRGNKVLIEKVRVVRTKVSATLNNVQKVDIYTVEENNRHTVYLLMSMPKKEITRSVVNQINQDKELYRALAKTKPYKKMLKEIK